VKNFFDLPNSRTIGNSILLVLLFLTIFIIPVFPLAWHWLLFGIFYTLIFFSALLTLDKYLKIVVWVAVITALTEWFFKSQGLLYLEVIFKGLNFVFFMIVVVSLISQVARTKHVNARVILEAINVYLLLGMVFAIIIGIVTLFQPHAFNFANIEGMVSRGISVYSELSYYAFVTLTTLGYGDIVPLTPVAKSVAIFTAITGQIYVAVVIAMLVGKFAGSRNNS